MRADDERAMPFLDHLEELRRRLLRIALALTVGFCIALGVIMTGKLDPVEILARPIMPLIQSHAGTLATTRPTATLDILMTAAMILGSVLAAPFVVYQLWLFLAPAMHKHERRLAIPIVAAVVALFLGGASLSYFVIAPATLDFLFSLKSSVLTPVITWDDYFDFLTTLSIGIGLLCELPMVILLITALGWVTPEFLKRFRRHVFVASFVASAMVAFDIPTFIELAFLIYALFEGSLAIATVIVRRKRARVAARAGFDVEEGSSTPKRLLAFGLLRLLLRPAPQTRGLSAGYR